MRSLSNHVVTSLVPELLGKDALLNETVAEIERRALEEAERTSPRYARGKEVRRRGYAGYRFLKGFRVSLLGRRVVYGLEWVTVRLPVLYRGGERVRTRVEEELLREEGLVLRSLLLPVLGGNAKLWTQELEVRGDFKYVVVDGKYVKLRGGRRGVLLIALGLTDHCVRAVLDVILTREEDVVSYWDLPVRLWGRYNLTLVVADGVKALDTAISRSGIKVARQTCLVHLKRRVDRRVRVLLDLLLSLAESVPTRGSPLLPPRPQGGPSSGQTTWPSPSTPSRRVREVPLPLEDRPGHSPQLQPLDLLSHPDNITRTLISS
ncbi:transposase [Metallosphaera yellowstonensis MK1]|uniref:Transposase n=1 Tax=Metallosphaera yellowstonensis MK1 TaxID=671065 RepID=H2C1A6_9CREN|nr:transposase [Metallosphaera yellowstonensis MK1]